MPGAGQMQKSLGVLKKIYIFRQILQNFDDLCLFLVIYQNISQFLPKISSIRLPKFLTAYFLLVIIIYFNTTGSLDAPFRLDARGRRIIRTPSARHRSRASQGNLLQRKSLD